MCFFEKSQKMQFFLVKNHVKSLPKIFCIFWGFRTSTAATCEDNCVWQSSFSTILAIISWQYYLAKKLGNKNSQKQTGNKNSQFGQQLLSRLRDCLSCNFFDEFLFAFFLCVMYFLLQFVFSLDVSTTKLKTRD